MKEEQIQQIQIHRRDEKISGFIYSFVNSGFCSLCYLYWLIKEDFDESLNAAKALPVQAWQRNI